ncbi:hypothetical protein CEP53_012081 [Fusarium sp. AF-6]|nr:hypothetical protein CEP53_012081 [Fusarium sp. AF-6]
MTQTAVALATLDPVHTTAHISDTQPEPTIHDAVSAIPPSTAASITQRWNGTKENTLRTLSCYFAFTIYGMNDGTPGAMVNAFVSRGWNWWAYYYLMLCLAVAAAATTIWSFWSDCGTGDNSSSGQAHSFTLSVFKDKVTLLFSAFMLIYVGAEITIGGWLVTFMLNVRNGTPSASSLVASGFWIGITVGRFALGWITSYFGEKIMVSAYLVVAIGLELAFWLGEEFVVSAIMAALVGVSIGMVMPSSIRMMTKILPVEKHIVSVGFGTAFAVSGASIFPFAVGALAQAGGVQVLQPVILALFAVQLLLWLFVTRMKLDRDEDSSA